MHAIYIFNLSIYCYYKSNLSYFAKFISGNEFEFRILFAEESYNKNFYYAIYCYDFDKFMYSYIENGNCS